jgi:hypothetical protein
MAHNPKFNIPEIVQDIHRAVRFVRHNAAKYDIDPNRLGIVGGSAGGHLSLMMATTGGPGKEDAKDPIDRETSAVQAVACFFPPTDFMNWREPGDIQVGIGDVGSRFKAAFGPRAETEEGREKLGREISPLVPRHIEHTPNSDHPWRQGQTRADLPGGTVREEVQRIWRAGETDRPGRRRPWLEEHGR